ncbi:hypothetical protein LEN26_003789 [Aphanomyces euteiches]|nr:hypothetical protein LEN26_003789 [Aphanomyces euteiches]
MDQNNDMKAVAEAIDKTKTVAARNAVPSLNQRIPSVITLDVGGIIYKVLKDTLLRSKAAISMLYLAQVVGSQTRVVDYLRCGELSFAGLNEWELRQIQAILDYLKLPIPACSWNADICCNSRILTNNNQTVESLCSQVSVMGDAAVKIVKIRLDSETSDAYVGFAPQRGFVPRAMFGYNYGYCFNLHSGVLSTDEHKRTSVKCQFTVGDVLTACQMDYGVVFQKNGCYIGIIQQDLRSIELFPYVDMRRAHVKLTILN